MATIYLIRHAEADYEWHGPDSGRPLSARGVKQARWMARRLAGIKPSELRTAPHQRCRQTAAELGQVLGIKPEVDDRLHIARSFRVTIPPDVAVWVSHSNNIPGALEALGVPCNACGHASAWVVKFDDAGEVASYDYIEPEV
ncbi:MAG: histidine phosphatase family protein [Planctomycetes bacterium]|nr:histidine phosphatase family protein [Planctomycetota bacterium]